MTNQGINIEGGARVKFENTNVGPGARMNVNPAKREFLGARMTELLDAIAAERRKLPAEVVSEAKAAEAELGEPDPQTDRIVQAMQRIREGATSAAAVVAAAGAVLRTLGVG